MALEYRCACGRGLSVSEEMANRKGRCPYCGASIRYPDAPRKAHQIVITTDSIKARPVYDESFLHSAEARARRLTRLLVTLIALVLVAGGVWGYILVNHRAQDLAARAAVFANLGRADAQAESGNLVEAWLIYRATAAQAARQLERREGQDAELQAAAARAATRAQALEKAGLGPFLPRSSSGGAAEEVAPPPVVKTDVATLVQEDPHVLHLDLAHHDPATRFTAAGLGVLPDQPLSRFLEIWGQPESRTPAEEPGQELWSYREGQGFAVEVTPPAPSGTTPLARHGLLLKVRLYPDFAGKLDHLDLEGRTARDFIRAYGPPDQSFGSLISYERPFSGVVRFDDDGEFQELTVYFQRTRRRR